MIASIKIYVLINNYKAIYQQQTAIFFNFVLSSACGAKKRAQLEPVVVFSNAR